MLCACSKLPTWEEMCVTLHTKPVNDEFTKQINRVKNNPPKRLIKLGRVIVNSLFKDPTYRKYIDADWSELVDLIADQVTRNRMLKDQFKGGNDLEAVNSNIDGLHSRSFNQLPCTKATVKSRVEEAKRLCKFDDPILLVGDDDLVSIHLARAGFRQITVLDIDPKITSAIANEAEKSSLTLRIFTHDITEETPDELISDYKLIFLDPIYSITGIDMFLKAALNMTAKGSDTFFFMSVSLMSLSSAGIHELATLLEDKSLGVCAFSQGFNAYPAPLFLRALLQVVNLFLVRSKTLLRQGYSFPYFLSDALLLRKINNH